MQQKRKKNANGLGSVYQRGDGRWVAQVTLPDGRPKRRYTRTKGEAERARRSLLHQLDQGLPLRPDERLTVRAYLDTWLAGAKATVRETTYPSYKAAIGHVPPQWARLRLTALEPGHVQKLYADLLDGGLAPATVFKTHAVLGRAIAQAMDWGLVSRNVVRLVRPPRVPQREMCVLDRDQANTFLTTATGDRWEALWTLAVMVGMRQGELLGLRWADIDLPGRRLHVRGNLQRLGGRLTVTETKTRQSRRTIQLPVRCVESLRDHRRRQIEERIAALQWADLDLVFPNTLGRPQSPADLRNRHLPRLLKRAGLPTLRFHDLRHTCATLHLLRGSHPKVVADLLGHSVTQLLKTYSHALPSAHEEAAAGMDGLFAPVAVTVTPRVADSQPGE